MSRFRLLLLFLCAVSLPLGAHDQKVRNNPFAGYPGNGLGL